MNKSINALITIFLLAVSLSLKAQISVYSGNSIAQNLTNQELNSAVITSGNNIEIGSTNGITFNADIDKEIQACNEITLLPNTNLIPPTTVNNSLHFELVPDKLEIYSISHSDISQVHAIERFETTVQLPQEISDAIATFKIDELNPSGLNPFMDWDIDLKVFYKPVANSSYVAKLNHGFYYEEYERYTIGNDYNNSGWNKIDNTEGFRVRLTFPEIFGYWEVTYQLYVNNALYYDYCPFYVNVIQKKPGSGFVKVADNNRVLERDNDLFLPIGHNAAWPGGYENPTTGNWVFCDYDCEPCESASFDYYYNTVLENYANEGVDFIRLILSPESIDIEFEKIGNYFDRLNYAWEIDNIIEFCENNDIYIDINMLVHYGLVNGPVYGKYSWDWGTYTGVGCDCAGSCYENKSFCYSHDLNISHPVQFCQLDEPKKFYKQKLRYLISRYGYSSNIAMFELISEVNQVGQVHEYDIIQDDIVFVSNPYSDQFGVRTIIYNWQKEMAQYIKGYLDHDQHILSGNYAGFPTKMVSDFVNTNSGDRSFDITEFDVMTYNDYAFGDLYFMGTLGPKINALHSLFDKPVILSEIGRVYEHCTDRTKLYNEQIWRNILSGACGFSFWGFRNNQFSTQHHEMFRVKDYIMQNQDIKNTLLGDWKAKRVESTENYYARKDICYIQALDPPYFNFGALFNLTDNYFTNITNAGTSCDNADPLNPNINPHYNVYFNNPDLNAKEDLYDTQSAIVLNHTTAPTTNFFPDFYGHNTEWLDISDLTNNMGSNGHTVNYNGNGAAESLTINHPPMYVKDPSVENYGYHGIIPFFSIGTEFMPDDLTPPRDAVTIENPYTASIRENSLILLSDSEKNNVDFESERNKNHIGVVVTNLLGQKVYEGRVLNTGGELIVSQNFPKGVLLVCIIDGLNKYSIRCVNL